MSPELKKILLALIVLSLIAWFIRPTFNKQCNRQIINQNALLEEENNETFDSVSSGLDKSNAANVDELAQPEINSTQPQHYEQELALATAASEFMGMPSVMLPAWGENGLSYGQADTLDNNLGQIGFGSNMCSKSCCTPQYPPPFVQDQDPLVCNSKDKFVSSNYTCNNGWQNSGCLCLTEAQSDFLGSRGENNWSDTNEI